MDDEMRAEYQCWINMRDRCSNPKNPRWHQYGGRGITICDRWLNSFDVFPLSQGAAMSDLNYGVALGVIAGLTVGSLAGYSVGQHKVTLSYVPTIIAGTDNQVSGVCTCASDRASWPCRPATEMFRCVMSDAVTR
jgi:hypothetical protein